MLYQRISACLAQSRWGIQNKEALSATACYTTLRAEVSALDMAFIADKLAWESRGSFFERVSAAVERLLPEACHLYARYGAARADFAATSLMAGSKGAFASNYLTRFLKPCIKKGMGGNTKLRLFSSYLRKACDNMISENRKVVLIGTGMVGMSYAYALLNQNVCDELVLVDLDRKRAEGEAMDLNHGLAFSGSNMKIYAGSYEDCSDADIVTICAGVAQKPGESRLDLLQRNTAVFKSIIDPVTESGFNGIFLVATNPVDIMTRITAVLSGFNPRRVSGTGTALDTARLRYLLGAYFHVDPRNMHAYVMGEHGDSEFVPWSQAMMATKPVLSICEESHGRYCCEEMEKITEEVRGAAQKIIEAKRATYYGIGMALVRITRAIFGNENSVLTVSSMMRGEYGETGVFVGAPCIVNRNGVQRILQLSLNDEEMAQFKASCETLRTHFDELGLQ